MVSFKGLIVLATMASAMFIHDRDFNTILSNLQQLDTSLKKMASDTKAWDGTTGGWVTLANDVKAVDDRVKSSTTEAKGESPINSANSKTVLAYISKPLTPDFKAALDAYVSRKSDFKKDGLTAVNKNSFSQLKADVDSFGAALKNLVSADQKATLQNQLTTLDGYLNTAIAAFS